MTAQAQDATEPDSGAAADRSAAAFGCYLREFRGPAPQTGRGFDPDLPLHGITVAVKDVIATREAPTTAQSRAHDPDWFAGRDAAVVRRLRAAGAVIVGKTTLAEYAIARPDPDRGFPLPRNPWDAERWTGGSSCGSAAGVAAGLFCAGIGTDTNGSIRIPAALCGVTGLKPTVGRLPTAGCLPLAPSLDTIGPLAPTARDCLRVLAVMAGEHPRSGRLAGRWRDRLDGVRIAVSPQIDAALAPSRDCATAFAAALDSLSDLGADPIEVTLPEVATLTACQLVTLLHESFQVHRARMRDAWPELGRPFRRTVALGALVDASAHRAARHTATRLTRALAERLAGVDALASPAWPAVAPRYDDVAGMGLTSAAPGLANITGFPAVAVPMMPGAGGLPLSLQLLGGPGTEAGLTAIADAFQRATRWHERRPPAWRTRSLERVPLPEPPTAHDDDAAALLAARLDAHGIEAGGDDLAAMAGLVPGITAIPKAVGAG